MPERKFSLCFECKWEPSDIQKIPGIILSKMIKFQGEKWFRVGLKNEASFSTLLFITCDVSRIGMDNAGVTFSSQIIWKTIQPQGPHKMDSRRIQLHTSQLGFVAAGNFSFTFQVSMFSKEPNIYTVECFDDLLDQQQVWSAAINQVGTDCELTAEGKKFFVHKFVVATRSLVVPRFRKKKIYAVRLKVRPAYISYSNSCILVNWKEQSVVS